MNAALKNIIALSFLSGAGLALCPNGSAKRVLSLLCTAMICAAILSPLREIDFDLLSLEEARLSSAEAEIIQSGLRTEEQLKKLELRKNCESYIEARGRALGLDTMQVSVSLRESDGGGWYPHAVTVHARGAAESAEQLRTLIGSELGIPAERQEWILDE